MKDVALWCLLLLALVSTHAKALEYTIHLSPTGTAPFAMIDRSTDKVRYYGIMYDFLDAFQAANPEYTRKTVLLPRKRTNEKMAKGEDIDIQLSSPSFVSPAIMKHYRFTDTLFTGQDKLVTLKERNLIYKSPQDLEGKIVGTIRGYNYVQFDLLFEAGVIKNISVDSHEQAIGMLHKRRIDAYIGNIHITPAYIKKLGMDSSAFVYSDTSLYEYDMAFAINNARPELYEKLNYFLKQFVSDGSLNTLIKSYIE